MSENKTGFPEGENSDLFPTEKPGTAIVEPTRRIREDSIREMRSGSWFFLVGAQCKAIYHSICEPVSA
jgi:hypothetical protein